MKSIVLSISILLVSVAGSFAQLTINTSSMALSNSTVISTTGDVDVRASNGLDGGHLMLLGGDQAISASNPITLGALSIEGGGTKSINGDVSIINQLQLLDGIVNVAGSSSFVMGNNADLTDYSTVSYVNGRLVIETDGTSGVLFPVGRGGVYTPILLENITGTSPAIGLEAINQGAAGITAPDIIGSNYSQSWHWEVTTLTGALSSAVITLPLLDDDRSLLSAENYKPVVLHRTVDGTTLNLGNASLSAHSSDLDTKADDPASDGVYLLGFEQLNVPVIHNIITPNDDGLNDFLTIDNLSIYPENEVMVVDRYGSEVYIASDYVSPNSTSTDGEDFSFLPPGNYICILRYTDQQTGSELTAKQTISVLK